MRLAVAALLFVVLVSDANAGPFDNSRSDVSDETGSSSVKLSMKKAKKAKKAKGEDVVVVDDDEPKTKSKKAKPAKKAKPDKAEETIIVVDDEPKTRSKKAKPKKAEPETIIIEDEPAKPAKKVKAKAKVEPDPIAIDDKPAKPTKKAKAKKAETVVIEDDEPAKPAKRARAKKTVVTEDDNEPVKPTTKVARAEDAEGGDDEPVRVSKAALAGPRTTRFYFRAGGIKTATKLGEPQFALYTDLPIDTSSLGAGSGVQIEQSQIPVGVIVGYVLPVMNRKLSVETVLGFPVKTKFKATGALADQSLAPTFQGMETGIPALGSDLGEATFASPLVTGVYRIKDFGPVTPIAGAGVMLLMARGAKVTNAVLNEAGDPKLSITPSPGFVMQGGAEVKVWKNVVARLDMKYVIGLRVKATVEDIAVKPAALPQLGSIPVGDAQMASTITPFVVQVGVGADF